MAKKHYETFVYQGSLFYGNQATKTLKAARKYAEKKVISSKYSAKIYRFTWVSIFDDYKRELLESVEFSRKVENEYGD